MAESLTQWEVEWALEKLAAPMVDVGEEEVWLELRDHPDDQELQRLYLELSIHG